MSVPVFFWKVMSTNLFFNRVYLKREPVVEETDPWIIHSSRKWMYLKTSLQMRKWLMKMRCKDADYKNVNVEAMNEWIKILRLPLLHNFTLMKTIGEIVSLAYDNCLFLMAKNVLKVHNKKIKPRANILKDLFTRIWF